MAINLFTKYEKEIVQAYTRKSVVKGKTSDRFNFDGNKSIVIPNILTQPLNDYDRTSAGSRYGTLSEVQDEVQEETCVKDRSFKLAVDKGNNNEQEMIKNAGRVLRAQIEEQVTPEIDKYAINKWAHAAGKIVTLSGAISKSTLGGFLIAVETHFDNSNVPEGGRYVIIGFSNVGIMREMYSDTEKGVGNVFNGWKGMFGTLNIIGVPDSYLPAGVAFLAFQTNSVILAEKIKEARIVTDSENVSGAILLGRYIYDAFVVGHIGDGVYLALTNGTGRAATAAITVANAANGSGAVKCDTANGNYLYYTLDGSDPRYSKTRIKATANVTSQTWAVGTKVLAYCESNNATLMRGDVVNGTVVD